MVIESYLILSSLWTVKRRARTAFFTQIRAVSVCPDRLFRLPLERAAHAPAPVNSEQWLSGSLSVDRSSANGRSHKKRAFTLSAVRTQRLFDGSSVGHFGSLSSAFTINNNLSSVRGMILKKIETSQSPLRDHKGYFKQQKQP